MYDILLLTGRNRYEFNGDMITFFLLVR